MLWVPCTAFTRLPLKRRLWRVLHFRHMVTLFSEHTLLGRTLVREMCLPYRQPLPWVVAYTCYVPCSIVVLLWLTNSWCLSLLSAVSAEPSCSEVPLLVRRSRRSRMAYLMLDRLFPLSPRRSLCSMLCGRCLVLTCVPSPWTLLSRVLASGSTGHCSGLVTLRRKLLLSVWLLVMNWVCSSVRRLYAPVYDEQHLW